MILTAEEMKKETDGVFKFILLEDDTTFIFHKIVPVGVLLSHKEMANGRKVKAAGTIFVFDTYVRIEDPWSSTLGIGCAPWDYEALEAVLGKPVKSRLED